MFCTPKISDYVGTSPKLDLKEFYTGNLKAHGVARNCFGKVLRKFTADIKGSSKGGELVLHEAFTYDDGRTFNRKWEMTKQDKEGHLFIGTGADILGQIIAKCQGCAAHLVYTLKIPSKKSKSSFSTLKVDHWQYKIDSRNALHFIKLKKFGFTIINSTVMFTRTD